MKKQILLNILHKHFTQQQKYWINCGKVLYNICHSQGNGSGCKCKPIPWEGERDAASWCWHFWEWHQLDQCLSMCKQRPTSDILFRSGTSMLCLGVDAMGNAIPTTPCWRNVCPTRLRVHTNRVGLAPKWHYGFWRACQHLRAQPIWHVQDMHSGSAPQASIHKCLGKTPKTFEQDRS